VKAKTRFKEVLRRSLGNLFNLCLEFYLDTRGFFPKHSFNHSVRGSRSLHKTGLVRSTFLQPIRTVLARPRNSFGLTETSSHGNMRLVLAHPRYSFRLIETSVHGNIRLVLARPRSSFGLAEPFLLNDYFCNNACTGLCCHFLWASRDIFAWQHMTCLGPPKELTKIKCRTSSSPPLGQPRHLCMALKACLGLPKKLIKIECGTLSSPPLGQPRHLCMATYDLSWPT
jgi:hypothetical protein